METFQKHEQWFFCSKKNVFLNSFAITVNCMSPVIWFLFWGISNHAELQPSSFCKKMPVNVCA